MEVGLLVEGSLDEIVGAALLENASIPPGIVYGKRGWQYIRSRIQGFNNSSVGYPILAIVDFMDTSEECPAAIRSNWVQNQHENMIFRVAVPEIESWLLADQEGFAQFLGIKRHFVPEQPDIGPDAKFTVMQLASRSPHRLRRDAIVPKEGFSASEGPLYTSEMAAFVRDQWNIERACKGSPSLRATVRSVHDLSERLRQE